MRSFQPCPGICHRRTTAVRQIKLFGGSSLQIDRSSAISPTFIARLIKGCRGDVSCEELISEKSSALSTL
jgi:hypothetical protein